MVTAEVDGTTTDAAPIEVLSYGDGVLRVLDQTRLPGEETWIACNDVSAVREAIVSLRVRGAPLIGVAAAYGLAVAAHGARDARRAVTEAAEDITSARPTAVNLSSAIGRVLHALAGVEQDAVAATVEAEARAIEREERAACLAQAAFGASLLAPGSRVMTYCNTGSLATGGIGSALGAIRTAASGGSISRVWVPETRPLLQGSRLTAWELSRDAIPYTVVADAAVGSLFAAGDVDAVMVGADRIAANGDVANKVGTYVLAVLAARHVVPFHVVAPYTTVDPHTPDGSSIPIEDRPPGEVRSFGGSPTAPEDAPVRNPAFDVTPAALVTTIVTDRGVHRPPFSFAR